MPLHIQKVEPHPSDSRRLIVTFSEPVNANAASLPAITPDANTVGLWLADSGSGTTLVDEVGSHNLNLSGSHSWVSGVRGGAIRFSGGIAQLAADAAFRNAVFGEWTWEARLHHGDTGTADTYRVAFGVKGTSSEHDSYMLMIYTNDLGTGKIHVQWQSSPGTYTSPMMQSVAIERDRFIHWAIRKRLVSGSSYCIDLYKNNTLVATGPTVANCALASAATIMMGSREGTPYAYGDGRFDSIRFSNVARSTSDLTDYYEFTHASFGSTAFSINGGTSVLWGSFVEGTTNKVSLVCSGLTKGVVYTLTATGISDAATSTPIASPGNNYTFGYYGSNFIQSDPVLTGFIVPREEREFAGAVEATGGGGVETPPRPGSSAPGGSRFNPGFN